MEKPGMGRRRFRIGPGLLGACGTCRFFRNKLPKKSRFMELLGPCRAKSPLPCKLLMFFAFLSVFLCPAFSQETGYFPDPDYYAEYGLSPETDSPDEFAGELEVLLETFPEIPEVHSEWMIRILVNHPNPHEVSVTIPDLPPFLVPDRIRTSARQGGAAKPEASEKWTVVDFFFVSGQAGPVSLAPFEVRVPGHLGYSPPVSALVRGDAGEAALRAVWEPVPASLTAGQSAEVRLRLTTGTAKNRRAALVSYQVEAPVNAIVETLDTAETGPGEFVLRFRIIPLEGPSVRLPSGLVKYGDASLIVPAREFRVLPAVPVVPGVSSAPPIPDRGVNAGTGDSAAYVGERPPPALPFPDSSDVVFPLFRRGYERALREARSYWDRGLYAEALAILRLNERELAAGPVLASPRRSAETALGLGFTEDEGWRPRRFFLALAAAASFILIFIFLAAYRAGGGRKVFPVTSGSSWGYTFIVILLCGMIGVGLYGYFGGPARSLRGRTGVLRETSSFRTPEDESVPDMLFREGETVRIRSVTDAWAYIESFDGKAGWVPLDRIIPY